MTSIWTVGHWTHSKERFLALLSTGDIEAIADVRAHPGSRRSPHFHADAMPTWLGEHGIEYSRIEKLGGRRPRNPEVPADLNAGWRNTSFKNYADYTQTSEFNEGIGTLTAWATEKRVAIMCGEPMPWRCHRLLVSNVLALRGWEVQHIIEAGKTTVHELGAWGATPDTSGGTLTYPPS